MVCAIIPAAGKGSRMKIRIKKQFLMLKDRPILAYTLDNFQKTPEIEEIILITPEEDMEFCREEIVRKYDFTKVRSIVAGGKTRQESVWNGLQAVNPDVSYIMVHDGARPFVTKDIIKNSIQEVKKYQAVAVAVPVKDTIKLVDNNDFVKNTLPRDVLRMVQTPQTFEKSILLEAFNQARMSNFIGTDEASLVEKIGIKVKLIFGSYSNLKITTPADLVFAEIIAERLRDDE